ncbi:MAG TPA: glycosyltransferase family 39 protein [Bryobacteraceae bacterium]|nr:glycosyltransferase family 39 protein [Bryobacteraceae bacterium]
MSLSKTAAVVVGAYAALLLWALPRTPLWLDEIQQFGNTRNGSLGELMRWAQLNAGASPLPYLVQRPCVDLLGYSAFAARFPAALFSILSGAIFVVVSSRFLKESRWFALAMFLVLPIQFRYGMEARPYSQGLLFSLGTLWLFLKLEERYSAGLAILYGLSVAAGLYSQPLTIFPALAQAAYALPKRRAPLLAVVAAVLSYLPWYIPQRLAQTSYAAIHPPTAFFSWRQIHPLVLLHDMTGGGYACAIPLLALAAWTIYKTTEPGAQRVLYYTLLATLAGPILMDAVFNYFFAERQWLFAMPALLLLAAQGLTRQITGVALAGVFLVAAIVKDFHQAITPRDDLAATADAIAAHLPAGACVQAEPPGQIDFYLFFRPGLQSRVCEEDSATPEVMLVASSYTLPSERRVPSGMAAVQSIKVGRSELILYRPSP